MWAYVWDYTNYNFFLIFASLLQETGTILIFLASKEFSKQWFNLKKVRVA